MDATDIRLSQMLMKNSRVPYREMAGKLGISLQAVHRRIQVLIDGCFLRCHGRMLENLIPEDRLVQFDALSHYKRYTDRFEVNSVPEGEIGEVARDVADWVLAMVDDGGN